MTKKNNSFYIMAFIAICSITAAIYSVMTYGQTYLHSDTEVSLRYLNSMLSSKKLFPDSWNYNNGELYTSSLIFNVAFLMHLLVKDAIIARVIASVVTIILTILCIIWFSEKIYKNSSWIIMLPLFFVFLRSNNAKDMILYQAAYIDYIVVYTLSLGFLIKEIFDNNINKKYYILNSLIVFLLIASGIRYAAEYVVPLIGALILYCFIEEKYNKEKLICIAKKTLCWIIAPSAVGYIFYAYICLTRDMSIGTNDNEIEIINSTAEVFINSRGIFRNLFRIFGYTTDSSIANNIVSVLIAIAIFFVGPLLEIFRFNKISKEKKTVVLFGIIHNIMLLGIIVFTSKGLERYLLSCVFIAIMLTADCCYEVIVKTENKKKYILIFVFTALTLVFSVNLINASMMNGGWKNILESQKKVGDVLVEKGVIKGYASYWNAYTYEYYSNKKVMFGSIYPSERVLEKHYTLVDMHAFEKKEGRSCILFTKEENELYNTAVHIILGPEAETLTINDTYVFDVGNDCYYKTDLVVYIYDEDVCDKLTDGIADGICQVNEMQFNWYGTMDKDTMYLEKGGFVHGPYSKIEAGHYNIKIEGSNLTGCDCSIVSEVSPEYIKYTVIDVNDEYIEMDLTLIKRIDDIQFCLYNPKDDTVEFKDVRIIKK